MGKDWIKFHIPGTMPRTSPVICTSEHVGRVAVEHVGRVIGKHVNQVTGEHVGQVLVRILAQSLVLTSWSSHW